MDDLSIADRLENLNDQHQRHKEEKLSNNTDQTLVSMHKAGVCKGKRWLVRDVDLNIERGEIVTLIGPNGSGKTTVTRLATGVLKPTSGKVARIAKLKIGHVPQRLNIGWALPLNVARLMTLTGHHSRNDIIKQLEQVGASHLMHAAVQELSGGEFQRVLLARAMIRMPDLLVLDEPVQGVDFASQLALYRLISDIRARTNCAILLVSHDLHVVMAETDRVVCLNGHVCCSGSPEHVAGSSEYLELFGEQARQRLAIYQHHHDHTHDSAPQPGDKHVR